MGATLWHERHSNLSSKWLLKTFIKVLYARCAKHKAAQRWVVSKFLMQHYSVTRVSLKYPNAYLEILTSSASYLRTIQLTFLFPTWTVLLLCDSLQVSLHFTQTFLRMKEIWSIPSISVKGLVSLQKIQMVLRYTSSWSQVFSKVFLDKFRLNTSQSRSCTTTAHCLLAVWQYFTAKH